MFRACRCYDVKRCAQTSIRSGRDDSRPDTRPAKPFPAAHLSMRLRLPGRIAAHLLPCHRHSLKNRRRATAGYDSGFQPASWRTDTPRSAKAGAADIAEASRPWPWCPVFAQALHRGTSRHRLRQRETSSQPTPHRLRNKTERSAPANVTDRVAQRQMVRHTKPAGGRSAHGTGPKKTASRRTSALASTGFASEQPDGDSDRSQRGECGQHMQWLQQIVCDARWRRHTVAAMRHCARRQTRCHYAKKQGCKFFHE